MVYYSCRYGRHAVGIPVPESQNWFLRCLIPIGLLWIGLRKANPASCKVMSKAVMQPLNMNWQQLSTTWPSRRRNVSHLQEPCMFRSLRQWGVYRRKTISHTATIFPSSPWQTRSHEGVHLTPEVNVEHECCMGTSHRRLNLDRGYVERCPDIMCNIGSVERRCLPNTGFRIYTVMFVFKSELGMGRYLAGVSHILGIVATNRQQLPYIGHSEIGNSVIGKTFRHLGFGWWKTLSGVTVVKKWATVSSILGCDVDLSHTICWLCWSLQNPG